MIQEHLLDTAGASPGWVGGGIPPPLPSPGERITVRQEHLLDTAGASPGWVGGGIPPPLSGREDHGDTGTPAGHGGSVPGLGGWGLPSPLPGRGSR